ncbi:MAG: BglG family transcription antiterminator [Bacillota bacterium]
MTLDKRSCALLLKILEEDKPLFVKTLSQRLHISERTAWYNLHKIDDWLISSKMQPLQRIHNKGVSIVKDQKLQIRKLLQHTNTPVYIYSTDERKKIIALELLNASEPLTIKDFQEGLLVSKNTVLNELRELREWFGKRKLQLVSRPKIGCHLEGEESKKRSAIKELIVEIVDKDTLTDISKIIKGTAKTDHVMYNELKSLFKNMDITYIEECVRFAEKTLEKEFAHDSYVDLVIHLLIAIKRLQKNQENRMTHDDLTMVKEFWEFEIAQALARKIEMRFHINVPEDEIGYITMHFIGTKVQKDLNNQFQKETVAELALTMVREFEKVYGIHLRDKEGLIHNLTLHLRPAIYRLKFKINIDNPLLEDIKKKYTKVYEAAAKVVKILEEKYDVKVNQEETAYVAMHFCSAIYSQQEGAVKKANVLLVCSSGVGTAKLLAAQLTVKFPQINVVDTVSSMDYDKFSDSKIDFIISTINIECKWAPTIVVNPLLRADDCKRIQNTFRLLQAEDTYEIENMVKKIMNSIANHCSVRNYEQLQHEITLILKDHQNDIAPEGGKPMLSDLITAEDIRLNVEAMDWEDAVYKGAKMLLDKGCIEEKYIEGIIKKVKEIGPYIVVAPGIALPHARPEDGVNHLSMSLITLRNPVQFGNKDNDPVKMVLTLAAVDNETHLTALSQLMGLLCDAEDIARILGGANKKEILDIIKKHSQKEGGV